MDGRNVRTGCQDSDGVVGMHQRSPTVNFRLVKGHSENKETQELCLT